VFGAFCVDARMSSDPGDFRAVAESDYDDLLEGLDGEARDARLELIKALVDDGCPEEDIRQAVAEERLALLPVDRVLEHEHKYSVIDMAEKTGLSAEQLVAGRAAFGLTSRPPEEKVWDDSDLELAEAMKVVLDAGVELEGLIELNRVIGRATLQVAAATRQMVADALFKPGMTEHNLGVAAAAVARVLVPRMTPTLAYAFEAHLRELLRSDVINAADIAAGRTPGAREMTVAFADLVGFTRLGEEIPAEDLGDVVSRLEHATAELVDKPVTFVKTVGDAVMLVSPQPDPLIDVALRLLDEEFEQQIRIGIACGPALERAGDWYGSPVNQASRVTTVARPGSVLVTQSVRDNATGDWNWSYARERKLKGVGEVKLHRARRAHDDSD
jgi:adenylate cyclase